VCALCLLSITSHRDALQHAESLHQQRLAALKAQQKQWREEYNSQGQQEIQSQVENAQAKLKTEQQAVVKSVVKRLEKEYRWVTAVTRQQLTAVPP